MKTSDKGSVLDQTVSMLTSYTDIYPIDINLLDYLNDQSRKDDVMAIRREADKQTRSEMKSRLPAVMISGRFRARGEQGLIAHSGLLQFDIDEVEQINAVRAILMSSPHVAYLSLSASGRGLFGIVPISNKAKHKAHFQAMQLYFKSLGVPGIDSAPANVSSLRGCSYDEQAYYNHQAQTFTYVYEPVPVLKPHYPIKQSTGEGSNPFDEYNRYGDVESLLLRHGWTYQHTKGTRNRYARPGKSSGISADYCSERKVLYVFSSDPATQVEAARRGYNHVQVFCQLECGNDYRLCSKKLRALGYGSTGLVA